MNSLALVFFQIIGFLVGHFDQMKQLVLDVEVLLPDAAGSEKAAAVKSMIAGALGVEDQIEKVWPLVSPIFNPMVKRIKASLPAAGTTAQ